MGCSGQPSIEEMAQAANAPRSTLLRLVLALCTLLRASRGPFLLIIPLSTLCTHGVPPEILPLAPPRTYSLRHIDALPEHDIRRSRSVQTARKREGRRVRTQMCYIRYPSLLRSSSSIQYILAALSCFAGSTAVRDHACYAPLSSAQMICYWPPQ